MTVAELIAELQKMPQELPTRIYLPSHCDCEDLVEVEVVAEVPDRFVCLRYA